MDDRAMHSGKKWGVLKHKADRPCVVWRRRQARNGCNCHRQNSNEKFIMWQRDRDGKPVDWPESFKQDGGDVCYVAWMAATRQDIIVLTYEMMALPDLYWNHLGFWPGLREQNGVEGVMEECVFTWLVLGTANYCSPCFPHLVLFRCETRRCEVGIRSSWVTTVHYFLTCLSVIGNWSVWSKHGWFPWHQDDDGELVCSRG